MIYQYPLDALNECLCKAEALAVVMMAADLSKLDKHVMNDYLWVLSDMVHEAKRLHDQITLIRH